MWEHPPLFSAHSFRPGERGAPGREGGMEERDRHVSGGKEGSDEEQNIDEITPVGFFGQNYSACKAHRKRWTERQSTPDGVWG